MTACQQNESGASEILGSVLMITLFIAVLAVLLVAIVSQPLTGTIPALTITASNQSRTVFLYHEGGEPIPVTGLSVLIDGAAIPFSGSGSDGLWSAGETLTLSSPRFPDAVSVVYTSGNGRIVLFGAHLNTQ